MDITASWVGFVGAFIGATIPAAMQWFLSRRERLERYKLVALEKRLEVHQQAFRIWRELMVSLNKPDQLAQVVQRGQDWWNDHCLYLDGKSRKSFYSSLVSGWLIDKSTSASERREIFKEINLTGKHLIEGVSLPFLGDIETKDASLVQNE